MSCKICHALHGRIQVDTVVQNNLSVAASPVFTSATPCMRLALEIDDEAIGQPICNVSVCIDGARVFANIVWVVAARSQLLFRRFRAVVAL